MSFERRSPLTLSAATWDSESSVVNVLDIEELEKCRVGRDATFCKCLERRTGRLEAAQSRERVSEIDSMVGRSFHFSIRVRSSKNNYAIAKLSFELR